jgi:hypothetical protein
MGHSYQTRLTHAMQKRQDASLTFIPADIIFNQEPVANLVDRPYLLNQLPDFRPNRIQSKVDSGIRVEDNGFTVKIARYYFNNGYNGRI